MKTRQKLFEKEQLSIQTIGKQRFYLGLVLGIITAVSTSLFVNYLRETYRLLGVLNENMLMMEKSAILFFNYFFAAISIILGLSIAICFWLNRPFSLKSGRRERIFSQFAQINAILPVMLAFFLIVRFGVLLSDLLFNQPLYDNHLNFYEEYDYLFVLLIVFLFYQAWATVRLIYKSRRWILISLLCCIVFSCILAKTTTVNQERLNTIYLKQYEDVHNYIDNELMNVKNEYRIEYDKKTIDALKKYYTESAIELTHGLQTAFERKQKLSLDTIILQKIVIHTFKKSWISPERYFWDYAYPEDVFYQLQLHDANSPQAKELLSVLNEIHLLINTEQEAFTEKSMQFTRMQRQKNQYLRLNLPPEIKAQMQQIQDSMQITNASK